MKKSVILSGLPLFACCFLVLVSSSANCIGAEKKENTQSKYRTLQVAQFDVDENVKDLPSDFQVKLSEQLVKDLQKTKKFTLVSSGSRVPASKSVEADIPAENTAPIVGKEAFEGANSPPTEQATVDSSSVLILTGRIIEFDPGSRGKRYIGLGMGAASVVAHVKFIDPKDSTVVFERDVQGKMAGGAFGGAASGTATELSKEIARMVKKQSF